MTFLCSFLLFLVNLGISWLNAWFCGKSWFETKKQGGFPHFVNWCAAIMAACGFTWSYLIFITLTVSLFGKIDEKHVEATLSLGYLLIILPVLGSGIGITIDSWAKAWRERNLFNIGVASYNTYADVYNLVEAVQETPTAMSSITSIFHHDDAEDNVQNKLVLVIVAVSLGAGIMTTLVIAQTAMHANLRNISHRLNLEQRGSL